MNSICLLGTVCILEEEVPQYFKDTNTGHYLPTYLHIYIYLSAGRDSSSGRAYTSGAVGHGLKSWPRHTKAIEMVNGTSSSRCKGRDRKIN